VLNPLRSEGEAFQLLLYVIAAAIAIVIVVVIARTIF
jgi:hypothetical protein